METKDIINLINSIEKEKAKLKMGYWKATGTAMLHQDGLDKKWNEFVERKVNEDGGILLDETLQIISMIKANIPSLVIRRTINQISSGKTILDEYLPMFVYPEIIAKIKNPNPLKQI